MTSRSLVIIVRVHPVGEGGRGGVWSSPPPCTHPQKEERKKKEGKEIERERDSEREREVVWEGERVYPPKLVVDTGSTCPHMTSHNYYYDIILYQAHNNIIIVVCS